MLEAWEPRVREDFNPSKSDMVTKIKRYTADLIDICEDLKRSDPRLAALAQTAYEEAAMWAVKCATTAVGIRDRHSNIHVGQ